MSTLYQYAIIASIIILSACSTDHPIEVSISDCEIIIRSEVGARSVSCTQYRGHKQGFEPDINSDKSMLFIEDPIELERRVSELGFAVPAIDFSDSLAVMISGRGVSDDAYVSELVVSQIQGRDNPEWKLELTETKIVNERGTLDPINPGFMLSVITIPQALYDSTTQE